MQVLVSLKACALALALLGTESTGQYAQSLKTPYTLGLTASQHVFMRSSVVVWGVVFAVLFIRWLRDYDPALSIAEKDA